MRSLSRFTADAHEDLDKAQAQQEARAQRLSIANLLRRRRAEREAGGGGASADARAGGTPQQQQRLATGMSASSNASGGSGDSFAVRLKADHERLCLPYM